MKIMFQHNMLAVRSPASVNPSNVDLYDLTEGIHDCWHSSNLAHVCVLLCTDTHPVLSFLLDLPW